MVLIRRYRQGKVGGFAIVAKGIEEFGEAAESNLLKDGGFGEEFKTGVRLIFHDVARGEGMGRGKV